MDPGKARGLMLGALPVITIAAYASAFGNGFVWDDHAVIEKGGLIGSLANVPALYAHDTMWNSDGGDFARRATIDTYRPFTLTTFALERAVFGLRPWGFHLVSVLVHAGNALLLLALGLRLGLGAAAAFVGAVLFAVHPSISEAVHWINGRSDPLAVACFLGGLLLWWPWLEAIDGRATGERAGPGRAVAVAALALVGSLSKELIFLMAGALPLVLLLRRRPAAPGGPSSGRMTWRQLALALAPWAAGLAVGFALRLMALGRPAVSGGGYHLAFALPRVPLLWADALTSLLSPAPRLVPSLHQAYLDVGAARMAVALAIVVIAVTAAVAARRLGGRSRLLWPWALATVLLTLAPIAMLTHSEGWSGWGRYLYPAAPLFCLALAAVLVEELLPRARPPARRLLAGLGVVGLLACAAQTFLAGRVWRDDETLAHAWIEEAPGSAPGYLALGLVHYERGDPQHALPLFAAAVARAPNNAEMHAKLGLAQSALGQRAASWQSAQRALALDPRNRLGRYLTVLGLLGQRREAEAAELLVPLMAEDPDQGLWTTMREAWQRTGPGSAFRRRVQALAADPRYRNVGQQLPTRVGGH